MMVGKRPVCPVCGVLIYKVYAMSSREYLKRFYCKSCDRIFKEIDVIKYQEYHTSWTKNEKPKINQEE